MRRNTYHLYLISVLVITAALRAAGVNTAMCSDEVGGCALYTTGPFTGAHTTESVAYTEITTTGVKMACTGSSYSLWLDTANVLHAYGSASARGAGDTPTALDGNSYAVVGITGEPMKICCGRDHSIVITTDNKVWTSGSNTYYQLGDGTTNSRTSFAEVSGVTAIDCHAGKYYSVVIDTSNGLVGWGLNAGLVSQGVSYVSSPTTLTPTGVVEVAGGSNHLLVRDALGDVKVMGANFNGQLGTSNPLTTSYAWETVSGSAATSAAASIAADGTNSYILDVTGTLWSAGTDAYGQLGNGVDTGDVNEFIQVSNALSNVDSFCSGNSLLSAVREGNLYVAGRLSYVSSVTSVTQVTSLPTISYVNSVACSPMSDVLVLTTAGIPGASATTTPSSSPTYVPPSASPTVSVTRTPSPTPLDMQLQLIDADTFNATVVADATGVRDMCTTDNSMVYITADGALWGMGENFWGELGLGSASAQTVPTILGSFDGSSRSAAKIACGALHVLVLDTSGNVWGAGRDNNGQLAQGSTTTRRPSFVQLTGFTGSATYISAGVSSSFIVTDAGDIYVAGNSNNYNLLLPTNGDYTDLTLVAEGTDIVEIDTASTFTVLRSSGGTISGVGRSLGGMADGETGFQTQTAPTEITPGDLSPVKQVVSNGLVMVLHENGNVYATGMCSFSSSDYGYPGSCDAAVSYSIWNYFNSWQSITTPYPCTTAERLSTGTYQSLLVCSSGELYVAGSFLDTSLGEWTAVWSLPERVFQAESFSSTAMGGAKIVAMTNGARSSQYSPSPTPSNTVTPSITPTISITPTATPSATPENLEFQLVNLDTMAVSTFEGATGIRRMCTTYNSVLYINSNGQLWGMGENSWGELGIGNSFAQTAPVMSSSFDGLTRRAHSVSCGGWFTIVQADDGTVWGAGQDQNGQMGLGSTHSRRESFVQLSGWVGTATHIITSRTQTYIINDSFEMYVAGANDYNALLQSNDTDYLTFTLAPEGAGVVDVAHTGSMTLMRTVDGIVKGIGNGIGPLGDGGLEIQSYSSLTDAVNPDGSPVKAMGWNGLGMFLLENGNVYASGICSFNGEGRGYGGSCTTASTFSTYKYFTEWQPVSIPSQCSSVAGITLAPGLTTTLLTCSGGELYVSGKYLGGVIDGWAPVYSVDDRVLQANVLESVSMGGKFIAVLTGSTRTTPYTPTVTPFYTHTSTSTNTASVSGSVSTTVTPSSSSSRSASGSPSVSKSSTGTASVTPSTTPSGSATPSRSVTATLTGTVSVSKSGSASPTRSSSESSTSTATPSSTRTISTSNTGTGSVTPSVSPPMTPSSSKTPSASQTSSITASASRTASTSSSPTVSESETPMATPSASSSGTPAVTPSSSSTESSSETATVSTSPTSSVSESSTSSESATPSVSSSSTATPSVSSGASASATPAPSESSSSTPSSSATVSESGTPMATPSVSPSGTPAVTPSTSSVPTPSPSSTESSSETATVSRSQTTSVSESSTSSESATPVATPSVSSSGTPAVTPSSSSTESSSETAAVSTSRTPSVSESSTSSESATPSVSSSSTATPSVSSGASASATPAPSESSSSTPSSSATVSESETPMATPSASSSGTPAATPSSSSTESSSETAAVSMSRTSSVSESSTSSESATPSVSTSSTATPSVSSGASASATPAPSESSSSTPSNSATVSESGTPAVSPSSSSTESSSETATVSMSRTPSVSESSTPSESGTPVATPSPSSSETPAMTPSPTSTPTPSRSSAASTSPSSTESFSRTVTVSMSSTRTPSESNTPSKSISPSSSASKSRSATRTVSPSTTPTEVSEYETKWEKKSGSKFVPGKKTEISATFHTKSLPARRARQLLSMVDAVLYYEAVTVGVSMTPLALNSSEGTMTCVGNGTCQLQVLKGATVEVVFTVELDDSVDTVLVDLRARLVDIRDSSVDEASVFDSEEYSAPVELSQTERESAIDIVVSKGDPGCGPITVSLGFSNRGPSTLLGSELQEEFTRAIIQPDSGVTGGYVSISGMELGEFEELDVLIDQSGQGIAGTLLPEAVLKVNMTYTLNLNITTHRTLPLDTSLHIGYPSVVRTNGSEPATMVVDLPQLIHIPEPTSLICGETSVDNVLLRWDLDAEAIISCGDIQLSDITYEVSVNGSDQAVELFRIPNITALETRIEGLQPKQSYDMEVRAMYGEVGISSPARIQCQTISTGEAVDVALEYLGSNVSVVSGSVPSDEAQIIVRNLGDVISDESTVSFTPSPGLTIEVVPPATSDVVCSGVFATSTIEYSSQSFAFEELEDAVPVVCSITRREHTTFNIRVSAAVQSYEQGHIAINVTSEGETLANLDNNFLLIPVAITWDTHIDIQVAEEPSNLPLILGTPYTIGYTLVNTGHGMIHPLVNQPVLHLQPNVVLPIRTVLRISKPGWRCLPSQVPIQDPLCPTGGSCSGCLGWNDRSPVNASCGVMCDECSSPRFAAFSCFAYGPAQQVEPWLPDEAIQISYTFEIQNAEVSPSWEGIFHVALLNEMVIADVRSFPIGLPPASPEIISCSPSEDASTLEVAIHSLDTTVTSLTVYHDGASGSLEYGTVPGCVMSSSGSCLISNLLSDTSYIIGVRASNEHGESEMSVTVQCRTAPDLLDEDVPRLVDAAFDNIGRTIRATFDLPTDMGSTCLERQVETGECNALFQPGFVELLGDNPRCEFISDREVAIVLGSEAMVIPGDIIQLRPDCVMSKLGMNAAVGKRALQGPLSPVAPVAKLIGPHSVSAQTQDITLDASMSSANGRPPVFSWAIAETTDSDADETFYWSETLAGVFDAEHEAIVQVPMDIIPPGETVGVELTVSNFLGGSDTVLLAITRSKYEIPNVWMTSTLPVFMRSDGDQTIKARMERPRRTEASAFAQDSSVTISTSSSSLYYRWSAEGPLPVQSSRMVNSLEQANGGDGLLQLSFPTSDFAPGSEIDLGVSACFEVPGCGPNEWSMMNNDCVCGTAVTTVRIAVEQPYIELIGGSTRRVTRLRSVDIGADIMDPNCDEENCSETYSWECSTVDEDDTANEPCSSVHMSGFTPGVSNMTIVFHSEGNYLLTLTYSVGEFGIEVRESTRIEVVSMPVPALSIDLQRSYHPEYVPQDVAIGFTATIMAPVNSGVDPPAYIQEWFVRTDDPEFNLSRIVPDMYGMDLVIPPGEMVAFRQYEIGIIVWEEGTPLIPGGKVPSISDSVASTSKVLSINSPPSGGRCSAPPVVQSGQEFRIQCVGWADEHMPLRYTFSMVRESESGRSMRSFIGVPSTDSATSAKVYNMNEQDVIALIEVQIADTMGLKEEYSITVVVEPQADLNTEAVSETLNSLESSLQSATEDKDETAMVNTIQNMVQVLSAVRAVEAASVAHEIMSSVRVSNVGIQTAAKRLRAATFSLINATISSVSTNEIVSLALLRNEVVSVAPPTNASEVAAIEEIDGIILSTLGAGLRGAAVEAEFIYGLGSKLPFATGKTSRDRYMDLIEENLMLGETTKEFSHDNFHGRSQKVREGSDFDLVLEDLFGVRSAGVNTLPDGIHSLHVMAITDYEAVNIATGDHSGDIDVPIVNGNASLIVQLKGYMPAWPMRFKYDPASSSINVRTTSSQTDMQCAQLDESTMDWSSSGCTVLSVTDEWIECACTDVTSSVFSIVESSRGSSSGLSRSSIVIISLCVGGIVLVTVAAVLVHLAKRGQAKSTSRKVHHHTGGQQITAPPPSAQPVSGSGVRSGGSRNGSSPYAHNMFRLPTFQSMQPLPSRPTNASVTPLKMV